MEWTWLGGQLISRVLSEVSAWLKAKISRRLTFELPNPINPIGRKSAGGGHTPSWSVKLRFIRHGQDPVTILELEVVEEGVGNWTIDELFYESGPPVHFPIRIEDASEFWMRARSPHTSGNLPIEVRRLSLRVRDQYQSPGRFYVFQLTQSSTKVKR